MEIVVLEHSYRENWATVSNSVCLCLYEIFQIYSFDILNLFFLFFHRNDFAFIEFVVRLSSKAFIYKGMIKRKFISFQIIQTIR